MKTGCNGVSRSHFLKKSFGGSGGIMKRRKRILYITTLAICLSIAIIILVFLPLHRVLVFQYVRPAAETLAFIPLKDESRFQIKYTHSIHLTDVVESYKFSATGQIQQYELMYEDFSIGMPANAEDGETFQQVDGKYYIKNMRRLIPSFYLRVGQVTANHRVIFRNREYPLSRSIKPGTLVKVELRHFNLIQIWKEVNILESL
jgi:hypothetical protein